MKHIRIAGLDTHAGRNILPQIMNRLSIVHLESIDCMIDPHPMVLKLLSNSQLRLKIFKGVMDQKMFDQLSKCSTLITFKPRAVEFVNSSKLVNFDQVKYLDLYYFLSDQNPVSYSNDLINYFNTNGHKLRSLCISLCDRMHVFDSITNNCHKLTNLKLVIENTESNRTEIVNSVTRFPSLKYFTVYRCRFTGAEREKVLNSLPRLISCDTIV